MADFKPILDALIKEGFYLLPDKSPDSGKAFDYKITAYSLNTKLSFRFDNLAHFTAFLKQSGEVLTQAKADVLHATFADLGLNPDDFFYVNFFEKGKELEM